MLSFFLKKFAGRHHRKYVEKCRPVVVRINEFEAQYQALTDDQLRAKTDDSAPASSKARRSTRSCLRLSPPSKTPPAAWSAARSSSATMS